jgi:hypothetical protein
MSSGPSTGCTDSSAPGRAGRGDGEFLLRRRVFDADAAEEAIELRLGQRIGAFHFDRVLRREHEKRLRQSVRLASDSHFAFLHRLEQRRLRLRRRAIDLIGEQHIGKKRSWHDHAPVPAGCRIFLEHFAPCDVCGHEVRCELHAPEFQPQRPRERCGEQRLAHAGHAEQQRMTAAEQREEEQVRGVLLANDGLANFGAERVACGGKSLGGIGHGSVEFPFLFQNTKPRVRRGFGVFWRGAAAWRVRRHRRRAVRALSP